MQTALIVLIVFGAIVIVWLSVLTYFVVRYAQWFVSHVRQGILKDDADSRTERFTMQLESVAVDMGMMLARLTPTELTDEEKTGENWVSHRFSDFWERMKEEQNQKNEEYRKRGIL
jgi:hypothetical protein